MCAAALFGFTIRFGVIEPYYSAATNVTFTVEPNFAVKSSTLSLATWHLVALLGIKSLPALTFHVSLAGSLTSRFTSLHCEQPRNASVSILVTVEGIVIEVSEVQCANAFLFMVVKPSERVTELSEVQ